MSLILSELRRCWAAFPLALHFAWGDTRARYRRSLLGPFWIVIGTAVGVVGLGVLWSALFKKPASELLPTLTIGMILWQLISSCVMESPSIFVRNASLIRNIPSSLLIFPVQSMLRQLINLAHNAVVIVLVLCVFPPPVAWGQLLVIPGLLLLIGNLMWMMLLLGMLGARLRDMEQLIGTVMPMLFFLSPVLYRANYLEINTLILWLNPFSYLITLVRDPLLGFVPPWWEYGVACAMLLVGWTVALLFYRSRYHRIAFWI